jgi:hypothetical protein
MIFYNVQSLTDPKKSYKVRLTDSGFRCDCPRFVFSSDDFCKHLEVAIRLHESSVIPDSAQT